MNKNVSILEFVGEWNNILLFDLCFWYKKEVNVYLEKYFGVNWVIIAKK